MFQGQEVAISTEGVTVCNNTNMAGVSFKCGRECGQQEYLFTSWEPKCHPCPSSGVTCSGENEVIVDYASFAKVTNNKIKDEDTPDNYYCEMTFQVYLCPAELCCTNISGCSFNGYNAQQLCAKNRDPNVNFCGKCKNGYSEIIGTYECAKCNENQLYLLLIPFIACFFLEMYLILRNPYIVTPLFTYVYKSLLYFYQILPILTYESYLSLVINIINVFDLSVLTTWGSNGTCLFANMTAWDKLWVNFIIPVILLIELLILRLVPEIMDWCKSRKTILKQLQGGGGSSNANYNGRGFEYYGMNDDEEYEDKSLQFEPSYDPTLHTSIWDGDDDSMGAGLLSNDTLHSIKLEQDMTINKSSSIISDNKNNKKSHKKSYQLIRKHIKRQEKFDLAQLLREHYKEAWWNTLLIIYIVVCESSIKMFNCASVGNKQYLWYAGSVECFTIWNYLFIAIFLILLLFPFYIVYSLWKLRGSLSQWRRIKFAAFTMSYRRKCWYYESVMMFRRIMLISVYAFPKGNQYLLRALISFFCGIILSIHVKVQPFRYKINNHLETLLLLLLFLVSTLSTVSDTTGLDLKYPTSTIACIPLLFLPYLAFRYCRNRVVPHVKDMVVKSKQNIYHQRKITKTNEQYMSHHETNSNYYDDDDDNNDDYALMDDDDDKPLKHSKRKPLTDDYNEYIAPHLNLKDATNPNKKRTISLAEGNNVVESFKVKQKKPNYLTQTPSSSSQSKKQYKYSSLKTNKKHTLTKTDGEELLELSANDSDDDMYAQTPLKYNQPHLIIGDDGQIELALWAERGGKDIQNTPSPSSNSKNKQKKNRLKLDLLNTKSNTSDNNDNDNNSPFTPSGGGNNNNNNNKKKGSWYNVFGGRERTISEQYQQAEKQQQYEAFQKEKIEKKKKSNNGDNNNNHNNNNNSGIMSNLYSSLKKSKRESTVSEQGDYDLSVNINDDDDENDIVSDLFLSPAAKRKKAAQKFEKKQQKETQLEMEEFSKASTVITHHGSNSTIKESNDNDDNNDNNDNDKKEEEEQESNHIKNFSFQFTSKPRYNSIGSHTVFSQTLNGDDEDQQNNFLELIDVDDDKNNKNKNKNDNDNEEYIQ